MTFGRDTFGGTSSAMLAVFLCARRANLDAGRLGDGDIASDGIGAL